MDPVDFHQPDRFTAGTVGEPGRRVFFLQAAQATEDAAGGHRLVTLRCEKQQVGALAEHLARIVADLAEPDPGQLAAADVAFVEPGDEGSVDSVIGRMGVAWDEASTAMVLVCEELVDDEARDQGVEPTAFRFRLTVPQVVAFVEVARSLVSAGRPPCYLCGLPMEPTGHPCPRLN